VVLLSGSVCLVHAADQVTGKETGAGKTTSYSITGIRADQSGEEFTLRVLCSGLPTYTMYELFDPLRLMLDVADASFGEDVVLPLDFDDGPVSLIQGQTMADKDPAMVRLEMLMAEQRSYSVQREGNDIVISFPNKATVISGIDVQRDGDVTRVLVKTNGAINDYFKEELPGDDRLPARMYIDIKDVSFTAPVQEKKVGSALGRIRMAAHKTGVRIVFDSGLADALFSYDIVSKTEGLEVIIQEVPAPVLASNKKRVIEPEVPKPGVQEEASPPVPEPAASETVKKQEAEVAAAPAETQTAASLTEVFPGYEKQKITVDFYKIDLHNVFRLFGEISGLNIVIDEGVAGNLTLSLNDVPWDFALDIILNLKDLQKEERFNTIVISPKSKEFSWPERKLDTLAVSSDGTPTTVESLTVEQKIDTPKEIVQAKHFMKMGREKERASDYTAALSNYEEAFKLWPDNVQLANRIASLYLAHEGMNAKAVHYAKEALKINEDDRNAALFAAIGLANMKKIQAAREYFDRSVSEAGGAKPSKEALMSYAVFNEENGNYVDALLLLSRHEQLYGDSLETMVAKARIYDKEGNSQRALAEYEAIMLSGYNMPADLDRFIKGRLAMEKAR
jgi:type IV pilus assembly protein PilQ